MLDSIFDFVRQHENYLIILILLAGGLLVVALSLCKVAADSDQEAEEIFKEFLTNKDTEEKKPVSSLGDVFDEAGSYSNSPERKALSDKNTGDYYGMNVLDVYKHNDEFLG